MPWAVIEHVDEETAEETCHIVPYVPVNNVFPTLKECEDFVAEIAAMGNPTVSDGEDNIIGLHKGHTLSATCACNPKVSESDPALWIHNAAN